MVNFATTMACVIVISSSVKKRQRNQSVKQRNVLAFRDSGCWGTEGGRERARAPNPTPGVRGGGKGPRQGTCPFSCLLALRNLIRVLAE